MTTSPNVMIYLALDGWRRQMVETGHDLLDCALTLVTTLRCDIEQLPRLEVLDSELLGHQASHDLDRMQVLIDVSQTGGPGYQCADWLRAECSIDVGMSDHRRILATVSTADDRDTTRRLLDGLQALRGAVRSFPDAPHIDLPSPASLQLETVSSPREAFFGRTEMVPGAHVGGRIAAEQLTPYPPGIPVVVPGERLNEEVVDYLQSGLRAGMAVPDATDSSLECFRVMV